MTDINEILTTAYYNLLVPVLAPVPVYRDGYVPNDLLADDYVTIGPVNNTNNSTMNSHDTETTILVNIYTSSNTENNTELVNTLAKKIIKALLPGYLPVIRFIQTPDGDAVTIETAELIQDQTLPVIDTGAEIFINRFLQFKHLINHKIN